MPSHDQSNDARGLHDAMAEFVKRGDLPGMVTLVAKRGQPAVDVIGHRALDHEAPMTRDTIFRIASLTKPITATLAMMLVEDGVLSLDAPVDVLLPELANRRVLKRIDGPLDETVPANRAITLRDLLTFRLGYGLLWGAGETLPILREAKELMLFGPPRPDLQPAPDEWMRRFGALPLMHQPGEHWMYNTGFEILSVLLERAAKRPLGALYEERLFGPLGMKDTGFYVPAAKIDRLATSYMVDPKNALHLYDDARDGKWSRLPSFCSAAGGLVSTVEDFFAFANMLRNQGTHEGRKIVSRESIAMMTRDQLTEEQKRISGDSLAPGFFDDHGWGFGFAVTTRQTNDVTIPGTYYWDGGLGTYWKNDPKNDLVAILFTQRAEYPAYSRLYQEFWKQIYAGASGTEPRT